MFLALSASVAVWCAALPGFSHAEQSDGLARTQTIADAATAFLASLNDGQRANAQFPFQAQPKAIAAHFKGGKFGGVNFVGEQYGKAMWSNYPVSDVPRPGLRLGDLAEGQRDAVMNLLRVLLSERGYRKVLDIMGSDQALADSGTPYASGRAAYTIAIFGKPGIDGIWMIQFGGHHLALNVTMLGGHGVLAPVLTGCLPAVYTENGRRVRALADENDLAFSLLGSLTDTQRNQAVIDHDVSTLALGPGHDDETIEMVGVKGSSLDERQKSMLFALASEWAGIVNDVYAAPRLAEIKDDIEDTYFAWSGPSTHEPGSNGASYFRIHGPKVFIEFSPQQVGGDPTMHVHTIYRDPQHAYGKGLA